MSRLRGLLLVGHGTRDETGATQFNQLADLLVQEAQRRDPSLIVQACSLEFQSPTIAEGWDHLVAKGVTEINVAPLLLFAAGHAKQDIPNAIQACAAATPHAVQWRVGRPLSRHAAIIDLVTQRITRCRDDVIESTSLVDSDATSFSVLMVGRGNHDPCARTDMLVLSEIVRHRLGLPQIYTAFYAMAQPNLESMLERLVKERPTRHVILFPHLLFDGKLYQAITQQVARANTRDANITFHLAGYLGPELAIAKAVCDRI